MTTTKPRLSDLDHVDITAGKGAKEEHERQPGSFRSFQPCNLSKEKLTRMLLQR